MYREQFRIQEEKARADAGPIAPSTIETRPKTPTKEQPKEDGASQAPETSDPGLASPGSVAPSSRPNSMSGPSRNDERPGRDNVFLGPTFFLPFSLPTSTDMLISYGAGLGGTNRERARKYIPTVPPEVLTRLDRGAEV
jgi:hypothetical protein